jgi:hypothetical protein
MKSNLASIEIGLNAAIVSIREGQPRILVTREGDQWDALPYGPFTPIDHRTLDIGLRNWVRAQTGLELGYVEQLYTFGDRGRHVRPDDTGSHIVSVGYLALITEDPLEPLESATFARWYGYLPWEDWRNGKPTILTAEIEPRLKRWAAQSDQDDSRDSVLTRPERLRICFAMEGADWDEEKVLERFELLYEAGLVEEAKRDGREAVKLWEALPQLGRPMQFDHRRVLATAMSRLRGKLKYRPVIFELLPVSFTLFELQKIVEAILGHHVHKQNFRRLVENAGLVEPTGDVSTQTGGRPAKLFRFRRDVLLERPSTGVRMKGGGA